MNLKAYAEKREALINEMDQLVDGVEAEVRAMTEEEENKFEELRAEIDRLDSTISKIKERKERDEIPEEEERGEEEMSEEMRAAEIEQNEIRAFADYVRGVVSEERSDTYMKQADNGAVIPKTIANKVIDKVKDICPIYASAEKYNVKGTLSIPYVDESNTNIAMDYATEMNELESKAMQLKTVDLTGFLAGTLSVISKKLINNTDIDVVNVVVNKMAEAVALFLEKECLAGTSAKIAGLSGVTQSVTSAAAGAISADDLISLKDSIKSAYQPGAYFIMHPTTLTMLRKLKDNNGRYLLNDDITSAFGNTLLGKDVYVSDQMPEVATAAGKPVIFYGNYSAGLAVKVVEDFSIEVLREKFATMHALGIVGWMELDAKIQNAQAITKFVMHA